jgi:hypothetical protein
MFIPFNKWIARFPVPGAKPMIVLLAAIVGALANYSDFRRFLRRFAAARP